MAEKKLDTSVLPAKANGLRDESVEVKPKAEEKAAEPVERKKKFGIF